MRNHPRSYQLNLVITLLDLKNAFGKLDLNLIKVVKSTLDNQIQNDIIKSIRKLKEENTLLSSLQGNITKTTIRKWNILIACLPSNIFSFCRKALIFSLKNKSYLARWKIRNLSICDLCGKRQR